jgi:hypothetical protein
MTTDNQSLLIHDGIQDGLYFLQLMKYGILQYTVVRPVQVFHPSPVRPLTETQNNSHCSYPRLSRSLLRVLLVAALGPHLCMTAFHIKLGFF